MNEETPSGRRTEPAGGSTPSQRSARHEVLAFVVIGVLLVLIGLGYTLLFG